MGQTGRHHDPHPVCSTHRRLRFCRSQGGLSANFAQVRLGRPHENAGMRRGNAHIRAMAGNQLPPNLAAAE